MASILRGACCLAALATATLVGHANPTAAQTPEVADLLQRLLASGRRLSTGAGTVSDEAATHGPAIGRTPEGHLRFLRAAASHHFPIERKVPGDPARSARNFLLDNAELLAPRNARVDFVHKRSQRAKKRRFERFSQTFAGIPIFGTEVIVQLDELDAVEALMSDIARDFRELDDGTLALTPSLGSGEAVERAVAEYEARLPELTIVTTPPALMIFHPPVTGLAGAPRLVWVFEASDDADAAIGERLLVDAHTGELVQRYSLVYEARSRNIYDAYNSSSSTLRRSEGNPPAMPDAVEVNAAYDHLGDTYDYYQAKFSRDSFDNAGRALNATVRYCLPGEECPWRNAHYKNNTEWISFGDGYAAADDIVAHEFTHGFTAHESGLVYVNASGAINESFSDIFGEFVDLWNGRGQDTADTRWLIGEDKRVSGEDTRFLTTAQNGTTVGDGDPESGEYCENLIDDDGDGLVNEGCPELDADCGNGLDDNSNGHVDEGCRETGSQCGNLADDDGDGAADEGCPESCQDGIDNRTGNPGGDWRDGECYMRSMKDPTAKSDPDRMSSPYYVPPVANGTKENDYGGVHSNSGVNNKLAFLLVDGTSGQPFNGQEVRGMGEPAVAALYYDVNAYSLVPFSDFTDLFYALRLVAVNRGWSMPDQNNLFRACAAVEINDSVDVHVSPIFWDPLYQDGSSAFPYATIPEGYSEAWPGDRLIIDGGTYNNTILFEKAMTIEPYPGDSVLIGN